MMRRLLSTLLSSRVAHYSPSLSIPLLDAPKGVYLDAQATTPIDPRVLDVMYPYLTELYANPHSLSHSFGTDVGDAVEIAREQIASLINAERPAEIIYTSGATESNNLAIKGVARYYGPKSKMKRNRLITTSIEHKCVLNICAQLEKLGPYETTILPVDNEGLISLEQLEDELSQDDVLIVSTMAVNNEIGVIQDLKGIGEICSQYDTFFHTDAAQGLGKLPYLDVQELGIDLLSMSSHKLYGPKGIGALYVRGRGPARVRLEPVLMGGGQERGIRGGTLPSFLCVGFGEACEIAEMEMERDLQHVEECFDRMYSQIQERVPEVYLNGPLDAARRYKGNLNLSFAYVEGEALMLGFKDLYVSSGSACTSATLDPSHVLAAINVDSSLSHTSIRFGFGRFTTMEEVDYAVERIVEAVERLRELSSIADMVEKGIDISKVEWDDPHH